MVKRLLVVGDDQTFARIISRAVGSLGFLTEQCHSSEQARQAFLRFQPDVVMIDLCMPDGNGLAIADEFLLTDIPVGIIFMSGYGAEYLRMAGDLSKYYAHPNVSVIGTPFRRVELKYALAKVTDSVTSRANAC